MKRTPPALKASVSQSRPDFRLRAHAALLAAGLVLSGCVVAPVGHHRYPPPVARPLPPAPAPAPAPALASPLYFYPERNQPETVQDRDRFECYRWAVRETGTDPGMTAVRSETPGRTVPPPPLYSPQRGDAYSRYDRATGADVVAGAATGAILGAAVASPRHAGATAVLGAIFGAALGAASGEARNRAIDDAQARQAAATEARAARARVPLDNFRRAMTACMEARGYRVQ
jgi:hypothetical protein